MGNLAEKNTTLRYIFLRIYSNNELQSFLTELLGQGLVIDHCRGNFLFFRNQQMTNARLHVATTECSKPSAVDDEQVTEYINIAQKKGWQLLCIGDYESLLPMRRRLYFYTFDNTVEPLELDDAINFQNAHRAFHSTLKWTIAWFLLDVLVLISTISFMLTYGPNLAMLFLDISLLSVLVTTMLLCFNRKKFYDHVNKGKPFLTNSFHALRKRENLMLYAMVAVIIGMLLITVV